MNRRLLTVAAAATSLLASSQFPVPKLAEAAVRAAREQAVSPQVRTFQPPVLLTLAQDGAVQVASHASHASHRSHASHSSHRSSAA